MAHLLKLLLFAIALDGINLSTLFAEPVSSRFVAEVSLPTQGDLEGGLTLLGNRYFYGGIGEDTAGLWATDGTTLGSLPWSEQAVQGLKVAAGQWLYYWVDEELWAAHESSPFQNRLVLEDFGKLPERDRMIGLGDRLLWLQHQGNDWELWAADAKTQTSEQLYQSRRGSAPSFLGKMSTWRGHLYFYAPDPDSGTTALWRSDGTPNELTPLLPTINSEVAPASTSQAFYTVRNKTLWRVDPAGEALEILSQEPEAFQDPQRLWSDGNQVFFRGSDSAHGAEIWVVEGATARRLTEINSGNNSSDPEILGVFDGDLFAMARDGDGTRFWQVTLADGVSQRVPDLPDDLERHRFIEMIATDSAAYFVSHASGEEETPWLSRIASTTRKVTDFGAEWLTETDAAKDGWPYLYRQGESVLFISAQPAFGAEVYSLNAEARDPELVKDANFTPAQGTRAVLIESVPISLDIQYFTVTTDHEHEYLRLRPDGSTIELRSGDAPDIGRSLTSNSATGVSFFTDPRGLWSLLPGASSPRLVFENATPRAEFSGSNIPFTTTNSGILFLASTNLAGIGSIYHTDGLPAGQTRVFVSNRIYRDRPIQFPKRCLFRQR